MKQKYKIPVRTKVEIISQGYSCNGKIGTLGAKDPNGLDAHNVWFDDGEFDCFMDDEFIPVQNILLVDNLDYETLCKIYDHSYLYETDRIIIKQKRFTKEEIEAALEKYTGQLEKAFSSDPEIDEKEGFELNHRGEILDLMINMIEDTYDDKFATAIEETVMHEQWLIEGFRKYITWNNKREKETRYFNPDAKIETIFI